MAVPSVPWLWVLLSLAVVAAGCEHQQACGLEGSPVPRDVFSSPVIVSVQDIFNSVIAALFLLVVALFAIIIKTNKGTLVGGVLGLILLVLCIVDAVLLCKKIGLDKARGRSAPAK